MAVIEQALDCGDKESALDTFQILVDRIKSDEAELVQETKTTGETPTRRVKSAPETQRPMPR